MKFNDFNDARLPGPGFYVVKVPAAAPEKVKEVWCECGEITDRGDYRYSFFATTENNVHPQAGCDCGRYYWVDTPRGFYSRPDHPISWRPMTEDEITEFKCRLFGYGRMVERHRNYNFDKGSRLRLTS